MPSWAGGGRGPVRALLRYCIARISLLPFSDHRILGMPVAVAPASCSFGGAGTVMAALKLSSIDRAIKRELPLWTALCLRVIAGNAPGVVLRELDEQDAEIAALLVARRSAKRRAVKGAGESGQKRPPSGRK